ncbi:MAG: DinB family protein, partial [Anaerolineales bacterium]|nr:DinB family protein [Anaerolineales bacterium]
MELNRKLWNRQQTKLRQLLSSSSQHPQAIELFMTQHAMVHSAKVDPSQGWSFEDEILNDMTEDQIRRIPRVGEHSIAWLIWHIARIEDVAMNMLVAG